MNPVELNGLTINVDIFCKQNNCFDKTVFALVLHVETLFTKKKI